MFSKKSRLSKEAFSETFESGTKTSNRFFTLIYKGFLDHPAKFAVVVPKKVEQKAVGRNTLRRRTYAALRALPHQPKTGVFIFLAKKDAQTLSFSERKDVLQELLEKTLATRR